MCPLPPLCVKADEAAAFLGFSRDHFDRFVKPCVPVIRSGRLRLYRVALLEKWAIDNESVALVEELEELRRGSA
jgi:hypothetical protein